MSLMTEQMTDCVLYNKITTEDGYGGYISQYQDGAKFKASIVLDDSIEAKIAQQQGVKGVYTIITTKAITLEYHDVFKRLEDGKIFRVTSDGDDKKTPASAALDMRAVSAEEWRLPNG